MDEVFGGPIRFLMRLEELLARDLQYQNHVLGHSFKQRVYRKRSRNYWRSDLDNVACPWLDVVRQTNQKARLREN